MQACSDIRAIDHIWRERLLESVYRECMIVEMKNAGLRFESERCINLAYKGVPINSKLRVDLLVEGIVVVELKAIECLHPIHSSQVITYLKLTDTQKKNESSS